MRSETSGRQPTKYKQLLSNTAIIAIGQLGSKLLVYLLTRLYTSVLTKEEYSIASNITDIATLLIPLISLGIGEAVFRFAMDKDRDAREVFSMGFVAIGLGFLLLPGITAILFGIDYFSDYVWLILTYILASAIHTNCSQFIRAQARFKLYAVQGILNTLLTIGLNILFLLVFHMGVVGYVLSVAVADLVTSLFLFFAARLWRSLSFTSLSWGLLKAMLVYSLPLIPTAISWWITNVSDRYMITFMKGDAVNGLYAAAYRIPTLLMVLIGIFNNAWKYSAVREKDSTDAARFFSNVYESFLSVIFLVSGGIIAFTKVLSLMMFGSDFRGAWVYIPILTLAMTFSALSSFTGTVFITHKKSRHSFITAFGGALLNVILNLVLIPRFSSPDTAAMGAALATFVSYFAMFFLRLFFSHRLLPYDTHMILTGLNFFTVALMTAAITFSVPLWILWEALGLALLFLINARTLKKGVSLFLKKK